MIHSRAATLSFYFNKKKILWSWGWGEGELGTWGAKFPQTWPTCFMYDYDCLKLFYLQLHKSVWSVIFLLYYRFLDKTVLFSVASPVHAQRKCERMHPKIPEGFAAGLRGSLFDSYSSFSESTLIKKIIKNRKIYTSAYFFRLWIP